MESKESFQISIKIFQVKNIWDTLLHVSEFRKRLGNLRHLVHVAVQSSLKQTVVVWATHDKIIWTRPILLSLAVRVLMFEMLSLLPSTLVYIMHCWVYLGVSGGNRQWQVRNQSIWGWSSRVSMGTFSPRVRHGSWTRSWAWTSRRRVTGTHVARSIVESLSGVRRLVHIAA